MDETSANEIADYFLNFCHEHRDVLTNLRLQKLVYYAQAWYLALHGKPLFADRIEAWVHGPVVPSLYQRFKQYGWSPITENPKAPSLDKSVANHLDEVFSEFGKFSAWDLERMTHQEEPWLNARTGLAIDEEGHNIISPDAMWSFYRKLVAVG